MAIQSTAQWWIRTDGDDTNGGGYDSGISGAGTNYSDQALPQLSRTDFATSGVGSTTLTCGGGFTSDMIGNSVRLSAGTNLTLGDYFIVAYTSSTAVTLDRAPDNGGGGVSGATGKLGGAWRQLELTCTTVATPCPNPVVPGNVINIRGDGSMNPTTQHYSFSGFRPFVDGNTASNGGFITLRGYNGLAHIGTPSNSWLWHYGGSHYWNYEYLKITANSSGNGNFGLADIRYGTAYRCIFNSNGFNGIGCRASAVECLFDYRTSSSVTYGAFENHAFGYSCENCVFLGHTGGTVGAANINNMSHVHGCLFIDCNTGIRLYGNAVNYMEGATRNTIVGSSNAGIRVYGELAEGRSLHYNLVANSAAGIKLDSGSSPLRVGWRGNAFYNNAVNYDGFPAGPSDFIINSDPFVDAANGNYALAAGSVARGIDLYANIPGYSGTSSYTDIGGIQHADPAYVAPPDASASTKIFPFRSWVEGDFQQEGADADEFVEKHELQALPVFEFSIGTAAGRDYNSLTAFFAAFDNTLVNVPNSKVIVTCYNDTGADQAVIETTTNLYINPPSNCRELVVTVDDDSWHKGDFGKGCVIRASGGYTNLLNISNTSSKKIVLERLVIDGDAQSLTNSSQNLINTSNAPGLELKDLLIQGSDGTAYGSGNYGSAGIQVGGNQVVYIYNCTVRNIIAGKAGNFRSYGMNIGNSSSVNNCTVYNITAPNSYLTTKCMGIASNTGTQVNNCISMQAVDGSAISGGIITNAVTDDATGTYQSTPAGEFVDAANGDFKLKGTASAAGIVAATNAKVTDITGKLRKAGVAQDAGAFNNVAGYDDSPVFPPDQPTDPIIHPLRSN